MGLFKNLTQDELQCLSKVFRESKTKFTQITLEIRELGSQLKKIFVSECPKVAENFLDNEIVVDGTKFRYLCGPNSVIHGLLVLYFSDEKIELYLKEKFTNCNEYGDKFYMTVAKLLESINVDERNQIWTNNLVEDLNSYFISDEEGGYKLISDINEIL